MQLDASRSRLAIYTEAEGLFSALAHDLELIAGDLQGEASGSEATVRVAVAAIRVSGVMKRGKLDPSVLSRGDQEAIERQIRDEILRGREVVARGTLEGNRAAIAIEVGAGTAKVRCDVTVERGPSETSQAKEASTRMRGAAEVSLAALGAPTVKGPLGAFRVKDRVRVVFDLVFG
jgi:hypothetical protein